MRYTFSSRYKNWISYFSFKEKQIQSAANLADVSDLNQPKDVHDTLREDTETRVQREREMLEKLLSE